MRGSHVAGALAAVVLSFSAAAAHAADPRCEIGTSLISSVIGLGDDVQTIGIPGGGIFGIGSPGVYVSIFLNERFAVEPQVNALFASLDDDTGHVLAINGQVNYFVKGTQSSSAYLFGKVGFLDLSPDEATLVGGGVGYRIPKGRLVFRFDGQLIHYTDDGGNALLLGVSIGGLF